MNIPDTAKIGIFDSGLGGLIIAKSIFKKLSAYDYLYLGDTAHLPYGNRSQSEILKFTQAALRYLFAHDCKLVIIACNTSSAEALRKIQREFLPKYYPDKKVLGVIVPTVEAVGQARLVRRSLGEGGDLHKRVGVIATASTAKSHAYKRELLKINPAVKVYERAAPKLVPLIEANRLGDVNPALKVYLKPLLEKKIDCLVLGCTHYPILKKQIKKIVGPRVKIISQTDIIPSKLKDYLKRHREISSALSKKETRTFTVTKINSGFKQVAKRLFGKKIKLNLSKV